jgi:hypothetical protein
VAIEHMPRKIDANFNSKNRGKILGRKDQDNQYYVPHCGVSYFRDRSGIFNKWSIKVPTHESFWVRTKKRQNNWPLLSGRSTRITEPGERFGKIVVVGHGYDNECYDKFTWFGTDEEFNEVWESDAMPLSLNAA